MESPAFRGSTIITTALVHSSSPPGFIADEKDLSPRGKVKTHNGCVVREKEKIILLKRVYGSPVRRSSRVRRKGCAVLPGSKIRHRHSDPAFYPHLPGRNAKTDTGRNTCSMDYTPIRNQCQRTSRNENLPISDSVSTHNLHSTHTRLESAKESTSPDEFNSLHFVSPNKYSEEDFFNSDGTPRRRLMVKITETPEIRRKLAEVGMSQLSVGTESKGLLPEDNLLSVRTGLSNDSKYLMSEHQTNDLESALGNLQCQTKVQEPSSDPCGEFLEFSSGSASEDDLADILLDDCMSEPDRMSLLKWQGRNADDMNHGCCNTSQADSENTQDQMDGITSGRYDSSLRIHIDSVDTSNELGNVRDPADEVLYISPLPFETSNTSFSFTDAVQTEHLSINSGECSHRHPDDVSFLPIHREQVPDSIDINLPAHTSVSGCIQNQSKVGSHIDDCAMSEPSWSPDHFNNAQLCCMDNLQSTETQPKCDMECLPPVNGLRPNSMLLMHLSTPESSRSVNRPSNDHLYDESQQEDKIGIINITPNHRVHDNMKGKEPSPTYASQANSESPYTPCSVDLSNQDEITSQSSVTSNPSPLKSNSGHGICSPSSKPNRNDNFQDFSEYEFPQLDGCPTGSPLQHILNSYEHCSDSTCDVSPTCEKKGMCESSPLNCDMSPSKSIDKISKYPGSKSQQTPINWSGMLESDAAYHAQTPQNVSHVCDSNQQCTSAIGLLANSNPESTQKKKQKKPVSRRSSLRIARRMSLMSLEVETNTGSTGESKEATVEVADSKSNTKEPIQCDTSVVSHSSSQLSSSVHQAPRISSGTEPDKYAVNEMNSSTFPSSPDDVTMKASSDLIVHGDGISTEFIDPETKCQPNTNTNNPVTLKTGKRKPNNSKQSNKQSRRSVRRNCAVLPMQEVADQPVLDSYCSESISAELDAKLQLDDDTGNMSKAKPKAVKSERKPSRRRSLRLNPVVLSPTSASPVIPALDAANVWTCSHSATTCSCMGSKTNSLDQLETDAQCSTSSSLVTNTGPLTDVSDSESSVDCGVPESDVHLELPFVSECNVKGKRVQQKMRRRSTRLLQSIKTLEDQPTPHQMSHSEETLQSHPLEDIEWNRFEQFSKTTECSPSPVSTDSGLDIQNDLDKCDFQATHDLFEENDYLQVPLNNGLDEAGVLSDAVENHQCELVDEVELAQDPVKAGQKVRPRRKSSVISYAEKNNEVKPKKNEKKKEKEAVKELYLKRGENKALKPNNLETIFEEPHVSKMGGPVYIGMRKCKRAVNFPEHPWLPRKKRKLPKHKNGRLKSRKKGPHDPSIDKKLDALLAEWTPVSPLPSNAVTIKP